MSEDKQFDSRKLLLNELPLIVLPRLAQEIGLNRALILQQIHYWTVQDPKRYQGRYWTFNSYRAWQEQFPFWSQPTIWRAISWLEQNEFIVSGNFNRRAFDRTKWYSINYEKVQQTGAARLFKMNKSPPNSE